MPLWENKQKRPPSVDFVITANIYRPLWAQAVTLWDGFLSSQEENPNYLGRIDRAKTFREKFPYRDDPSGGEIRTNDAVVVIAQYLSAYKFKTINADRLDKTHNDGEKLLIKISVLSAAISDIGASLSYSDRTDAGEDTYGDLYFAASHAREAHTALTKMIEHLGLALGRTSRTKLGLDTALRRAPEETFAFKLGQQWAAAGISTTGGEGGGGIDEILAYVIEKTDESYRKMNSRKKWLYQRLMPLACDGGKALRDGCARASF